MLDLLMLILNAVLYLAPIFVFLDATHNNIGRNPNFERGFLKNWQAIEWVFCCILTLMIGVILYLLVRKKLIEAAKIYPVKVPVWKRLFVVVFWVVIFLPFFLEGQHGR